MSAPPGRGSRTRPEVPAPRRLTPLAAPSRASSRGGRLGADRAPVRVLCVAAAEAEVEPVRAGVAGRALGGRLEWLASEPAAVERLLAESVDVVLLDDGVRQPPGLELLRALRAARPGLPVVFLARDDADATAREALRLGAYDCLAKRDGYLPRLARVIENAAAYRRLSEERDQLAVRAAAQDRREHEAAARHERLATLLESTRRLAAYRPYRELLSLIAQAAPRLLGASGAVVRLLQEGELVVVARSGALDTPPRLAAGEGLAGRVVASGQPLRIADLQDGEREAPSPPARPVARGIRAYLGVPLRVRDRVSGVLSVYAMGPVRFTDEDAALLAGFAGQAAVAVEHARLTEQLLHTERLSTVGRMVAGVAHELNNPLAVVLGTLELLQREPMDRRVADRLTRVTAQARRAVKIVRSLLAFARKKPSQRQAVELNELIARTLDLDAYEFQGSAISVERRFQPDLPPIQADPDQLQQVFTNLFLNASQAMRDAHGGGTLTVTTAVASAPDRIAVSVADDGPGIRPEHLPQLFEAFFTTKGEGKGTGLGLTICRRIVESHEGRIGVRSEVGRGTTVTVELPIAGASARVETPMPNEPPAPSQSMRVLLVEDEPLVAEFVEEILVQEGHEVDQATNGREALARVASRSYGLIVSDVRMPDLDGPAFYAELSGISPALASRVVFITGDVMSADTRRFFEETGLLYLEKPFGVPEFQTLVRRALRRS